MTVFADASHQNGHGQLFYLAGILLEDFSSGSTFQILSWTSHKSQQVKSVTSAETLAAGEDIDEGKVLVKAIEELLYTEVKLAILLTQKTCSQLYPPINWLLIDRFADM